MTDVRFYITGGTLPIDAASYVPRKADAALLQGLQEGEFCYVLDTRQMGKSSLMVRTADRLSADGVTVLMLDLTAIGQNVQVEEWYDGLLNQIGWALGLEDELDAYWHNHRNLGPMQRWFGVLREVVLPRCPTGLVVFVDEIDVVRSLPFSTDEFFAGIRECYNLRAKNALLCRLTFCLLGVATPASLIRDLRMTPFNIGRRIDLHDFSQEEAEPLASGMDVNGGGLVLLRRVLWWTGGHPYLTQRLCRAVAEADPQTAIRNSQLVDRLCGELFLSRSAQDRDDNLLFVRDRLLRTEADMITTLELYNQIRAGRYVPGDDLRPSVMALFLTGLVRAEGGRLRVRNRIYERVFNATWIRDRMPDAEKRRQRDAYRRGMLRASLVASAIVLSLFALVMTSIRNARRTEKSRQEAQTALADRDRAVSALDAEKRKLQTALTEAAVARSWADRAAGQANQKAQQARIAEGLANEKRIEANLQKHLAQARTKESRTHLARFMVTYGTRLANEGDLSASLLWYVRAASLDSADPANRQSHRLRLAATLRQIPRLTQIWLNARSARFSPDGRRVITANDDGAARIWDAATGTLLVGPMKHGDHLNGVSFSVDGHQVLTIGGRIDRKVRVWNAATGRPVGRSLRGPTAGFSRDGRYVLCVDYDSSYGERTARLYEAATGRVAVEYRQQGGMLYTAEPSPLDEEARSAGIVWIATSRHDGTVLDKKLGDLRWVVQTACSPDGQRILISGYYGANILHAKTGEFLNPGFRHERVVGCFSPDGTRVVTSTLNGATRVWNVATGAPVTPLFGHTTEVYSLAFSPNGRRVVTVSMDMTARVWDAATGQPLTPPLRHGGAVTSGVFDATGTKLLTCDTLGVVRQWEVSGVDQPDGVAGEFGNVACAAFSPDGKRLITGDFDYGAQVWDATTGRPLGPLLVHTGPVRDVVFSPDGKLLATASNDGFARIWDVATSRQLARLPNRITFHKITGDINHLVFDSDGRRLMTVEGNTAYLWDMPSCLQVATLGGDSPITSVAFSPDGKHAIMGCLDSTARVYDTATGRQRQVLNDDSPVWNVAFSTDGRHVLTAAGAVQLWDTFTGRLHRSLIRRQGVEYTATFSPDGRRILTVRGGREAQVWDIATGKPVGLPMSHQGDVVFAAFSHNGRYAVTCSRDRTARVWDASTGEPITPPLAHARDVRRAVFSPDDRRVLTVCDDGLARIWRLSPQENEVKEVQKLAEVLAARRMDMSGGMAVMEPNTLHAAWQSLRPTVTNRYGPTSEQEILWHASEAMAALEESDWTRLLDHLDRYLAQCPTNRPFRALRAYAHAQRGNWREVLTDNAKLGGRSGQMIVMSAHHPIKRTIPPKPPLQVGQSRYRRALSCEVDHEILVLLPAPARRFMGAVGTVNGVLGTGIEEVEMTVKVTEHAVFRLPSMHALQIGVPVEAPLEGATAFVLRAWHRAPKAGMDPHTAWADARVELMDGRILRLTDLPLTVFGGL